MTEQTNNKHTVLTALVAVLVVAVVAQSVVILGLHKRAQAPSKAEAMNPQPPVIQQDEKEPSGPPSLLPSDPFDNDPFDWHIDDWDPFKEIHSMHDRINQMFGNAFNRFEGSDDFGSLFGKYSFSPDINIQDKGDHYLVTVDLPGAEDSQLDVKIDGQTLTIAGSVKSESKEEDGGSMLRQERRRGQFRRVVTLPSAVRAEELKTEHKKGVLHIEIPKQDE